MNVFWVNHRWAIATFAAICLLTAVFPVLVSMSAEHYVSHPAVIPLWERALMGMGALVRTFRVPIVLAAGVVVSLVSLSASQGVKQQ